MKLGILSTFQESQMEKQRNKWKKSESIVRYVWLVPGVSSSSTCIEGESHTHTFTHTHLRGLWSSGDSDAAAAAAEYM